MKNIFNHNQRTSLLKSSLRAKRGNLYTSIRSLQSSFSIFDFKLSTINHKLPTLFAQSSRRKAHGMLVLLFIFVMLIQSGCSLFGYYKIERYLGTNSICWEDNDHILIYANIAQYWYSQSIVGGESKEYDWTGGEIWRITASTGAKELLFRSKSNEYALNNADMSSVNGNTYISGSGHTYKFSKNYDGWDTLGSFTFPIVSPDERYIVGAGDEKVKKYDLVNGTEEELYNSGFIETWLDYDYDRNYLLVNSNKFVDLNTGEEVKLIEDGDIFNEHYSVDERYINTGEIVDNKIFVNIMMVRDEETMEVIDGGKAFIEIGNWDSRNLSFGIFGVLSPNRDKYAVPGLFTDTIGDTISQWSIPFDEL